MGFYFFLLIRICLWKNAIYAITDKRIIVIKGLLTKSIAECPLTKIQNINVKIGLISDFGNILFDTAGGPLKELLWLNIYKPQEIYRIVSTIINK